MGPLAKIIMDVLITGITGFVGSHMVDYLLADHPEVSIHGLARWRSPLDNLRHIPEDAYKLHYGDLNDLGSLIRILQEVEPDTIVHLAAQSVDAKTLIPITRHDGVSIIRIEDLFSNSSMKNTPETTYDINGVETEVINLPDTSQVKALGFVNGMGTWFKVKQISRHLYNGPLIELTQKWGRIRVTPNHCVYNSVGQVVSPITNPDLLPMRHLNWSTKNINKLSIPVKIQGCETDGKFKWTKNKPNQKIKFTLEGRDLKAFARFAGAYISEGCVQEREKKNYTVIISSNNLEWLKEIRKDVEKFYIGNSWITESKKGDYKSVYNLGFDSKILSSVTKNMFGKYSANKQLPNEFLRLEKEFLDECLQKMYEGDGCVRDDDQIDYTTKSEHLAAQLCLIWSRFKKDYTITFEDIDDNTYYHIRETGFYNKGLGVKKLKEIPYNGYVYDIAVEEVENFTCGVGNIIVHNSYVVTSFNAPADTLRTNIIGTNNLLEAIRITEQDPLVLCISSSEVYGQVQPDEVPIKESCPFRPASPYAVSKVGEDMIAYQYFLSYDIRTIRTRMFTHCAARRNKAFVVPAFARQIARIETGIQEPTIKVGNLDSVRTFADVRDTVRAYWLAVERCAPGEVYNIGGSRTMTILDMLSMLLELSPMGGEIQIEVDPKLLRPSDVTLQIPDCSKFKAATGWEPEIPFEDTLRDILNYWREVVQKYGDI